MRFVRSPTMVIMTRRASDAQLSAMRYDRFFDLSLDLLCIVDFDGSFVRVNPAFARATGYADEELLASPLIGFIHPDDRAAAASGAGGLLHGENIAALESRFCCKDGSHIWLSWTATASVEAREIYAIARDVTGVVRERQADQLLATASEALTSSLDYRETLHNVARLVVPALADWCAIDLGDADDHLTRVAIVGPEEQQGPIVRALLADPNDVPVIREVMERGVSHLLADARDDHRLRPLGIAASMVVPLIARGRTLGAINLITTVSGRHYDARDLALAEDLARRAALAVDNARLYREAQSAIKAREQFLTVAAHELRTPLTAIRGNAELILRRVRRTDLAIDRVALDERLGRLLNGIDRMSALAARLLDVTRMQTGAFELATTWCDLVPIVASVVERARGAAPRGAPMTIAYDAPATPIQGRFDPLRIEQVVTNLIDNAVKYQPTGGMVRVQLAAREKEALLSVADEGIGIAPEDLPRLFASYVRAESATSQQIGGVGVGLYITDQIVRRHGGKIDVSSVVGKGTTFIVRLPLR